MRIIAGSAGGVRLAGAPPGTRPVSDRAREGLFSSLGDRVHGARVLDLFAGSGAVGLEALSRGATDATFVERSARAVGTIEENLERTGLGNAHIVTSTASAFLAGDRGAGGPFDLVVADPPYELEGSELDDVMNDLDVGWLAGDAWTVVLTRGRRSSTPVVPLHWAVARRLAYGDSLVLMYREVRWA